MQTAETQQATPSPARKLLPRFPLGRVVMTQGAADLLLDRQDLIFDVLMRHSTGDWGDMCDEDKATNEAALERAARLMSRYVVLNETFYVFTEGDRSITTIMLPSEY